MQGRRFLGKGLLWLLAPAWLIAACGGTVERVRNDTNGAGGAAGTSKGGSRSDQPAGGSTLLPMPVAGRGGTQVMVEGGSGGTQTMLPPGVSDMPKSVECAPSDKCSSAAIGPVYIDPCCAEGGCGLETGALALLGAAYRDSCQAKDQPGELDANCPTSAATSLPFPAGGTTIQVPISGHQGCCRDDGKCGVLLNELSSPALGVISKLGLGCVDSAPFFDGKPAAACGAGGEGFGGAPSSGTGGASAGEGGAFAAVGGAG